MKRGQTLALAALTMLLLALMVLVTLSIGFRVRDRIEAQIAADSAAYSQAVEVARLYNEIAVLNRVQVAMLASTTAMSSLISWSSHHVSNLVAAQTAMGEIHSQYLAECNPFNPCPCTQIGPSGASLAALSQERSQVASQWNGLEKAATEQINAQWMGALQVGGQGFKALNALLDRRVKNQLLAKMIAGYVYADGVQLQAPDKGDRKNGTEIGESLHTTDDDKRVVQSLQLVMGTRGYDFATFRAGRYQPIHDRLDPLVKTGNGSASVDPAAHEGTEVGGSSFGPGRHDNKVRTVQPGPLAWAEDHGGSLSISWPAGSCSKANSQSVRDTLLGAGPNRAQHSFSPGDDEPASQRHKLIDSPNGKIFPNFVSFNFPEIAKPKNDFGQPKLYSILERDYARVPSKPWELRFAFHFSPRGAEFDNGGPRSRFQSPAGADLRQQVALGSSIVYYHRPGAWVEPPNFFNPFWRATLYAADDDVEGYLRQAGYSQHAQTMRQLLATGWAGTQ